MKIRKLKTGSKAWMKSLMSALVAECPELCECDHCGRVIRSGYVCRFCKSENPGDNTIRPEEWISP